ncbi:uncharacterized protein LOC143233843 isoform X8 [Tachypleus tridentatus]|uniref:uncharacterized protein LOC143233843 isoform X8 n=1 Tax=Tachypleus tridentatus TaxID=6853 RepID=UPI003FD5CD7E
MLQHRESYKVAEFCTDELPVRPARSRARMRKSTSVVSNRASISNPLPHGNVPVLTMDDDCAINELLEGRMDLDVILPDENKARMNVERKMPMMDLLVQVTTANKISPGGHVIQVLTERGKEIQYKPNTPIGSLDTKIIYIVSKSSVMESTAKKLPKISNKTFEQTFRLQVKLPRNQLTVLRVSPKMTLAEVKRIVCSDKNLDINNYHLVRPSQPNNVLDLNITLANYGSTEINLLSNKSITTNIYSSATDLIAYSTREDERTKKGILGILTRKKSKGSLASSSSDGANSQGYSPNPGNDQTDQVKKTFTVKPSVKKRPAPPPPSQKTNTRIEISDQLSLDSQLKDDNGFLLASHSRQSSDSSGYHEASVFSELPENTFPETSSGSGSSGLEHSDTMVHSAPYPPLQKILVSNKDAKSHQSDKSNLTNVPSTSSISVVSAVGKKRKAPPPPPKRDASKPELDPVREMGAARENDDIQSEANPETLESEFREGIDVIEDTLNIDHEVKYQTISEPSIEFVVVPSPAIDDIPSLQANPPPEFADNSDKISSENLEKKSEIEEQTVKNVQQHQQQNSLSSSATTDDIENTFEHTIAEDERALERDQEKKIVKAYVPTEADKASDMMKGSACFNLNITHDQLLSHIEAAFSAVEQQAEDVLPDEPASECNTLPGPPYSFRDNDINPLQHDEDEKLNSTEFCAVLSSSPLELHDIDCHAQSTVNVQEQAISVKQTQKAPLTNFVITSYKKENIYGSNPKVNTELFQQSVCVSHSLDETGEVIQKYPDNTREENKVGIETTKPRCNDQNLNFKEQKSQEFLTHNTQAATYLEEESVQGFRGQVKLRCTQLVDLESSPFTGRSTSMLNLAPLPAMHVRKHRNTYDISETLRRVQSEHNVNNTSCNSECLNENEELQAKYEQLKEQLLGWQQKLVQNQKLLQNGTTNSKVITKSLEQNPLWINDTRIDVKDSAGVKLQKLSKEELVHQDVGLITKRQVLPKNQKRPKSQMLTNVTIGSWQQRNHQEEPSRSKFHSVENLTYPHSGLQISTLNGKCIDSCFTNAVNVPKFSYKCKEEPKLDILTTSQGEEPLLSSVKSVVDLSEKHKKNETESHCNNRLSLREPKVIKVSNNNYKTGAVQTYIGAPVVKGFSDEVIQNLLKKPPTQKNVIQTNESGNSILVIKSNKNMTPASKTDLNMIKMNLPAKPNNQQLGSVNVHQNISSPSKITTASAHSLSSMCKPKEKKKTSDFSDIDPRDKLMIDIRNFQGRSALRKVTVAETNWKLKAS